MNAKELPQDNLDYRQHDKVVCISTEKTSGPGGNAYSMDLELGKIYVVHAVFDYKVGKFLHVGPAGQYPASRFKLVARQ